MNLIAGSANRRRRCHDFGPDLLPTYFPGAKVVDGCLVKSDQCAEWPADEMEFVLNDEVRWPQWIGRDSFGGRQVVLSGVRVLVVNLWRAVAVPFANALNLAEEHLHGTVPRHLCELVHRGDEQRRQPPINLLVH